MRNFIVAVLLVAFPLTTQSGPVLDAINVTASGPVGRAITLSDVDVFSVVTTKGDCVLLEFEQPGVPKVKHKKKIDLTSGRMRGPCVGCGSSSCGMCVINSLARHGQSYDYIKTLSHTEMMRLHYRLHNEPDFKGVKGKTQTVGGRSKSRARRLFRRR